MQNEGAQPHPIQTSIAVVIPAFRVEKQIQSVIQKIPPYVNYIIVVNDASPDETQAVVESIHHPNLFLVHHQNNQGVGGAMVSGYNKAVELGAEIIIKIDGDDQMDSNKIPDLIQPIIAGKADYTKGNRFLHATQLQRMPLLRRIGNWSLTFLVKLASGYWPIFDPANGYTALHAEVWKHLDQERIARDFFFETSMLINLRRLSAVIKDVHIPAIYQDEDSSLHISNILLTFPLRLLSGFFSRIYFQYFLYDFSYASLAFILAPILLLFGFLWGIWYWHQSNLSGVPATTGTVLIAVLPIILGMQLLLQGIAIDIGSTPDSCIYPELKTRLTHPE